VTELEVVQALARAWMDWQKEDSFPFDDTHCINGARVAVRALEQLGVKAKPVSVRLMFANAAARALIEAEVPVEEWPTEAWSVGVAPGATAPPRAGRWGGHLMVEGDGWTLDVSFDQMARPGRLVTEGPLVAALNLPDEGWVVFDDVLGQRLLLATWRANNGWRDASGWKNLHPTEVAILVARTRALLEEAAEGGSNAR
jgi:hypothetical protein